LAKKLENLPVVKQAARCHFFFDDGSSDGDDDNHDNDGGDDGSHSCRMDLPGPTTSVGTRTDYSVGPWGYSACATRHLMAWGTRTMVEKYSDRKLYMFCTM
jgi:hypothetical protein